MIQKFLDGDFRQYKFSKPVIIDGTKQRAQFGYTVAAIGDIDQDGYQGRLDQGPATFSFKCANFYNSILILMPADEKLCDIRVSNRL